MNQPRKRAIPPHEPGQPLLGVEQLEEELAAARDLARELQATSTCTPVAPREVKAPAGRRRRAVPAAH